MVYLGEGMKSLVNLEELKLVLSNNRIKEFSPLVISFGFLINLKSLLLNIVGNNLRRGN